MLLSVHHGAEDAENFVLDMLGMYRRYAAQQAWSSQLMASQVGAAGVYHQATLLVNGTDAFTHLRHENGIHRLQRHATADARMRTSTIAVLVIPDAIPLMLPTDPADLPPDFNERIRTYHYPRASVTDHRLNLTIPRLSTVLDGYLDPLIAPFLNPE